jgi:hypothetical protein
MLAITHRNHIVFIGDQVKIDFCREMVKRLAPAMTHIRWLVVNADQRDALIQDYSPEDILYLPLSNPETRATSALKINDLVYHDRRLMHMLDRGHVYLRAIRGPHVDSLGAALPTAVMRELADAYEVLTYRLARVTWGCKSVLARLGPET